MGAEHTNFGPFTLDRSANVLLSGGRPIAIGQRAYSLLEALATAEGPVSKSDLIEAAWPGTVVEEGNLTVQIAALRKALGVRPDGREWIVTVPRVGYRLIRGAPLNAEPDASQVQLPRLAVLPFRNLSEDAEQVHFTAGLVEDVIAALGRFKSFEVVSRNKEKGVETRSAGTLEVAYLIEGSVRRAGQRLRVNIQLIDTGSGAHLWAKSYDGDAGSIFDMQDAVTACAAALIGPKIEQAEIARSYRERPGSGAVYDLYLRALQELNNQREAGNTAAIALLDRAIATAPAYARVLAAAAHAYEHRFNMTWPPLGADDGERCLALARAALEADKEDALVLAWSGLALQSIGREFDVGLEILKRAVDHNPNDVRVLFCAGVGHLWGGTIEDAAMLFQRILTLSPADPMGATEGLAHIALIRGEFDEALEGAMAAVVDDPNHDFLHWIMIAAYAYLGRMDDAARALRSYLAIAPNMTLSRLRMNYGTAHRDRRRSEVLLEGLRLAGMLEE